MHHEKKRLLILYDWFYPGFMAGGPIQSLTNLSISLLSQFEIHVITSGFDLNASKPYSGVALNAWSKVCLPRSTEKVSVFYASKKSLDKQKIEVLIKDIAPSVIYLNGIFSYHFFLLPLSVAKKMGGIRVVVCPRGMLKKGALSSKAFKKKIYIAYLKVTGILKKVYWHATTVEEAADVKQFFPVNRGVLVAANIPKAPDAFMSRIEKEPGQLKLVYLSLINEHKNLLLLLQSIRAFNAGISLDIYGPVIDPVYWERCTEVISQGGGKAVYKGLVEPVNVQEVLAKYHALILLTKGENFGHAIFESLSVARPVITSKFTPWNSLYEQRAGANVEIDNSEDIVYNLKRFAEMNQEEYNLFCSGAHSVANSYYQSLNSNQQYEQLFSSEQ